MISFTYDAILFLIFIAFVAIYEMILWGILTMETLRGIFAIIYIIVAGVIIFLRKYLSLTLTSEKSQVVKPEKMVLVTNNELSDHKWAGIWYSIVHLAIKKSKHFYYNALSKMEWNIMNHSSKYESGRKTLC